MGFSVVSKSDKIVFIDGERWNLKNEKYRSKMLKSELFAIHMLTLSASNYKPFLIRQTNKDLEM